ncbi:MAG: FG-GAP-like repeat-containing protein, partial [Candidatus Eiseniibacteriota bacterium]
GAVAFVGMSRNAAPIATSAYQERFLAALWQDSLTSPGEALAVSRLALAPLAGPAESDHRWTHLALNLLGDPETPLWTRSPGTLEIEHVPEVLLGAGSFEVRVASGGAPLAGARVCLARDDAYAVGETGADGRIVLPWTPPATGPFTITATRRGAVPARSSAAVVVSPGAVLVATGTRLDDGGAGGNGDGRADQGERLDVRLTLANRGGQPAVSVTATLASDPLVEVLGQPPTIAVLPAGDSTEVVVPIAVADSVPDAAQPLLGLDLASAGGTFGTVIALPLHVPTLAHRDHLLEDPIPHGNGNGIPEPGEGLVWTPTIQNRGNGTADSVVATARVVDRTSGLVATGVAVIDSVAPIGRLEPWTAATGPPFRLSLGPEVAVGALAIELTLHGRGVRTVVSYHDLEPPPPPQGLEALPGTDAITLHWQPVAIDDPGGYDVLRGVSAFGPFGRLTPVPLVDGATFTDSGLETLTTYYYAVVTRDASQNRSPLGEVVSIATGPPRKAGWPLPVAQEAVASAVAADLDGEPGMEIVTGADALYVWHADGRELRDGDQSPLTSGVFTTDGRSPVRGFVATPAVADLDADGAVDVVAVAWDAAAVYAWAADGTPLAGWPQPLGADFNWASPVIDDLDLDGDLEVIAVQGKLGRIYGWHHDGEELADGDGDPSTHGVLLETGTTFLYATPAVGDVDGDGFGEIVVGENAPAGRLHVIERDGTALSAFPRALGGQVTASAALADLDDDGHLDIVVSAEPDRVVAIDAVSGADLPGWPRTAVTATAYARTSSPVVVDLDGDGELDVVDAASDGRLHVWRADGSGLPGWESVRFATVAEDATQSTPTVADVDGDGGLEVLVGAANGAIHAWHAGGARLAGFPLVVGAEVRASPVVWDVDEDGLLELVAASVDRQVHVWELEGELAIERIGWPFMRRDVRNTGRLGEDFLAVPVPGAPGPPPLAAPRLALAPNPTRGATWLHLGLPAGGPRPVAIRLYDVQGRLVAVVLEESLPGGDHRRRWDGRDARGVRVASGIYFLRWQTGNHVGARKLTILR